MEETWKEWLNGEPEKPKYPDRAFLAWARTFSPAASDIRLK